MFSVLTAFTENEEAKNTVKGLISGQPLVPEGENIFSLGQPIIDALSVGLRKLDNSNLAYAIFVPMLKNALMSSESYFIDMGLDIEYIKGGIDECYRDKCFGEELANILKRFKDIGNLAETISSGSDTTELLNRIAESSDSIIKILDTIANCKIFNPTPIEGRFEPNGNYFNLISNLFNQLNMDGFTFDRNDEEFKNMVWVNKYDNNDNILKKSDGSYYGENGNFVTVIKEIGESDILTHINNLNSSDPGVEKGAAMNGIADCIEDVLSAVDKSIVAKKTVSALFDSFLGDFIGVDEHISFSNVTDWEEEGHNLAEMLRSMQSILGDGGFDSLDFSAIKDVVALNDMLHNLASSGIFVDKNNPDPDSNYQFGRWLYQKIESTLGSFPVGSDSIELLKDPDEWDDSWGDKTADIFYLDYAERYSSGNSYIAYRDFVSLTKEEWCSETYSKMDTSSYVTIAYEHYYDNPAFIDDFDNGINRGLGAYTLDEIDHLSSVIYHVGSLASLSDIADLSADSLSGILNSINNCSPLRICVYNLYDMATKFIPEDVFSLKPAYNKYLIRGDALDMNPINSRNDRQSEIDKFADLFNKYKEMSSGSGIFGSGFTLESIDSETILNLKELLKDDLATSKVFHLSGSALYRDDGKYYPTVFENVIRMIFDKSFATILYNEDSPKDIAYKTTQYAKYNYAYTSDIDKNSKLDYIVDSCFSGKSLAEVSNNVDDIFECIYSVIGGTSDYSSITYDGLVDSSGNKTADFTQVDLTGDYATTNINSLNKLMKLLNASELLYDCVPNALDKALSTFSFSGFGNVNLSDTSIYYHYNYNYNNDTYSLDYERKYDEDEIDNFCDILLDAQALKGPGGSSISLSDKSGIQHLIDGDENSPLRNLLVDLHKSYSIHLQNEYLNSPTHETVFEQVIDTLCSSTTLSLFAYNGATSNTEEDQAAAALKLKNNIKAISNYENNNIVNPNGYYSKWMSDSAYGTQDNEIDAIMAFLGTAIDMMGDGDFSLTGDMSLDKLTPANVESILGNLNRVDIIKDAVPQFIKSGLGSVLGSYSTYDAVDYAYYNLSQVVYGGTNSKGDVNEGSEIYAICALLNNLYDDDNERYIQATDINSLHSSDKKLNGLMYFLFNTHIYNTNAGEYNVMHDKNGYPISGRGIFLYNIISQTGIDMSGYITGSNSDERIAVLSRIFTLSNADYRYESNGLCRLIGEISSLSLGTFSGSVDSVSAIKDTILEVMEASYDALGDGSNHRAYFTSELIAHLLDDSIESEYSNLATNHPLYYYEREYFAARSGLVRTYEDVTNNSYDNLNEIEKNGMDGAISLLEYVDSLVNLQAHSDEVRANFAKMGDSPDTNSFLAKVYYLSQAHESLYGITNESHLVMFGLNWQDIVDPYISGAGSIYADDFVFEEYGDSLADWLHI